MFGNAKFAVSSVETVAVLWGCAHFICFFKEIQALPVFLIVFKQHIGKKKSVKRNLNIKPQRELQVTCLTCKHVQCIFVLIKMPNMRIHMVLQKPLIGCIQECTTDKAQGIKHCSIIVGHEIVTLEEVIRGFVYRSTDCPVILTVNTSKEWIFFYEALQI